MLPLINRLITEALLTVSCGPRFSHMLLQLIDVRHWILVNMFLRVGFSWCLQALVDWCGFVQPEVKVNDAYYCDVLLLKSSNSCCQTSVKLATFAFQRITRTQEHQATARQDSGLHTRRGLPTDQTSVL